MIGFKIKEVNSEIEKLEYNLSKLENVKNEDLVFIKTKLDSLFKKYSNDKEITNSMVEED